MKKQIIYLLFTLFAFAWQGHAQCNYTLEMNDSFGDGWNGNTMDVLVNGTVVLDDVTLDNGSQGTMQFPVNTGDDISTVWNGGGSWGSETSYRILDANGIEVAAASEADIPSGTITANCPSCLSPSNLSVSNVTDTSADLSWTDNSGGSASYIVEWREAGSAGWNSDTTAAGVTNYTLTGLTASTQYEWQLTADCGGGDTSLTISGNNFYTSGTCGTYTVSLIDSYGDGWNGGTLDIYKNGNILLSGLTLDNGTGPEDYQIPVDINDILSFDYTPGSWSSENQYIVYDSNGVEIANEGDGGSEPGDIGDPTIPSGLVACPTCPPPTDLTVVSVTTDTADLSWTDNTSGSATYIIEYSEVGTGTWNSVTTAAGANTYTLTGLSPHTGYQWKLKADCGGGDTSAYVIGDDFFTNCAVVDTFPYDYGFEDTTSNLEANWDVSCWSANPENTVGAGTTSGPFRWNPNDGDTPSSSTGPSGAHTGNQYAYAEASGAAPGDEAELISPTFDFSSLANGVEMSFFYYMYGSDMGELHVDTYNGTTWTNDVWTISGEQQTSDADPWLQAFVHFPNDVTQIRFRAIRGNGYTSDIAVDDISLYETPSCAMPENLNVSNITTDSADLSWTDNNGGTSAYIIEYRESGTATWNSVTTAIGATSYTLTGLNSATSYEWQLTADCGGGSTSITIAGDNFITLGTCGTFTVSLIDSFGDGWNGGTLDVYVNGNLFMDDLTLASGSGPEDFLIPVNNNDILSFDYTAGSWSTENQYIVYDSNGNEVANEGDGNNEPGDIGDPTVPSGLVACPSCPAPTDLTIVSTASNSVDLAWTDNTGGSASYVIEYSEIGTGTWNSVTTAPGATSYTLTGLSTHTGYEWKLYADCGGGDTSMIAVGENFYTDCDTVSTFPYEYGFEDVFTNTGGDWSLSCWSGNPQNTNASATEGPYRWTSYNGQTPSSDTGPEMAHSGTQYAYTEASGSDYGDVAELISPPFDMSSMTTPELTFYYHMYGEDIGGLHVDTYDGTTWSNDVWVLYGPQQTSMSDPWTLVILPIDNTVTKIKFRATRGNGYKGDIAIDDIRIHGCRTPSDLAIDNLTTTSVDLTWTDNSAGAASYLVEWREVGATTWNSDTTAPGATSYHLTGLTEKTDYEWQITADCGAGGGMPVGSTFHTWYCDSTPISNDGNGITKVRIRYHEYTIEDVPYKDLTDDVVVELKTGDTADMDVTFETGIVYAIDIWIDYNDNLSFDPDELVFSGQSTLGSPSLVDTSFLVDANANLGEHVMRIGSRDADLYPTPDPCFNDYWGVTIDLKVKIVDVLGIDNNNADFGFNLYPNPASDILNVTADKNIESLQVFDLLGQEVINVRPNDTRYNINVDNLKAGTYVIRVNIDGKTGFYRFIKN